jgi:hypothetical protein
MMGFSVVYWVEEYASFFKNSITKSTENGEYVIFKMPFALPYQSDWPQSRTVEGKIQHGDEHYQMLEQVIEHDTLYMICKTDENARFRFMELAEHVNQHIKETSPELPQKTHFLLKSFLKEYTALKRPHIVFILEWLIAQPQFYYRLTLLDCLMDIALPPPKITC